MGRLIMLFSLSFFPDFPPVIHILNDFGCQFDVRFDSLFMVDEAAYWSHSELQVTIYNGAKFTVAKLQVTNMSRDYDDPKKRSVCHSST